MFYSKEQTETMNNIAQMAKKATDCFMEGLIPAWEYSYRLSQAATIITGVISDNLQNQEADYEEHNR